MATNWTDPTVNSGTHIRATHINELRSVVDKNRVVAGLGAYAWTDSPVTRVTHIRAVHFTELQSASQDLWNSAGMGTIGGWSYGSAPASGVLRPISARDITDLRSWIQQYQDHMGPSYDPNYWGVDSAAASNSIYPNTQLTVFDYITQQTGAVPTFWGRYIGGLYALTSEEVSFLHGKNCKILLIYNGATATSVQGSKQDGVNDANNAISAAGAVGVPNGKVIFADIEGSWNPSSAWIQGWSDTMFGSVYAGAGGLYANTDPKYSSFDTAYCQAFNADDKLQISVGFIYANEPEPGCGTAATAPAFGPLAPSCNTGGVVIWQYAESCYATGTVGVDEDIANATGWYYLW